MLLQVERVQVIDANMGTLLATYSIDGFALSGSPALAGDILYVCGISPLTNAGGICAINATSGDLLWKYSNDLWWSSPAVANGVVYVSSSEEQEKDMFMLSGR